ncbi:MAG: hypothetical protein MJZ30_03780 [Paludibacteraceae bacterium]|nr:hypothetical protein [Paludibacteraceae bacterium]
MHIGQQIEKIFREQGRKVSWFADKLCCDRRNIYKIFERESIDTALLARISILLGHDFLQDLSDELNKKENK